MDAHLHNIRSSHPAHPGRNRWHDKPLTLIVEANSRAGAMGEHSPVDALVPSIMCDYAVVQGIEPDDFSAPPGLSEHETEAAPRRWRRLDWVVDERIRRECIEAEERARKIVEDSDNSVLWFSAFGAEWVKQGVLASGTACVHTGGLTAIQLACPPTASSRWRCSLHGTGRRVASRRRTKRP